MEILCERNLTRIHSFKFRPTVCAYHCKGCAPCFTSRNYNLYRSSLNVSVFARRPINAALKHPTSQVSWYGLMGPQYAVDGLPVSASTSVWSCTNSYNYDWWSVDLGLPSLVDMVLVSNNNNGYFCKLDPVIIKACI